MDLFGKLRHYFLKTVSPDEKAERFEGMSPLEFQNEAERLHVGREISGTKILFEYSSPIVRDAIWEIKFRGNKRVAHMIATLLYPEIVSLIEKEKTGPALFQSAGPLLLPIPISAKRRRERGWNQCEIIADEIAALDRKKSFETRKDILTKIRDNADQIGKGRADRLANLEHSFSVKHPEKVADRHVIIIDDVVTTGATLAEARRALRDAGASTVSAIAIAH